MTVTSLYLDTKVPKVPGTKSLSDFILPDVFNAMPKSDADWLGQYYFGSKTTSLLATADYSKRGNNLIPAGGITLTSGHLYADVDNSFDTDIILPAMFSLAFVMQRPANNATRAWVLGDYQGLNVTGSGFAISMQNNYLNVYTQVSGSSDVSSATVNIPDSVSIGSDMAVTAFVTGSAVTLSVYDPSASNIVSGRNTSSPHAVGTRTALIGSKYDNNTTGSSLLKCLLVLNGDIGAATTTDPTTGTDAHNEICKYLLAL